MTDPGDLVMEAVGHGLGHDSKSVLEIFDRIQDEHGPFAMAGVVGSFGYLAKVALDRIRPPRPGDMWAIDSLGTDIDLGDPSEVFAARYVVATANGHADTAQTLLDAEFGHPDPARFPQSVIEVFGLTISLLHSMPKEGTR